MQIRNVIIKVDDQDKALAFYTEILGFVKTRDDRGRLRRWLTVAAPEGPTGVELVLEPNSAAPARAAQKALYDGRYPAAILSTNNIAAEYRRLKKRGVRFRGAPKKIPAGKFVFFDDTCGNFIVLREQK
jgi:catechol 2,3-dioxygenase-like lactoylglutathione lyase family enzyme